MKSVFTALAVIVLMFLVFLGANRMISRPIVTIYEPTGECLEARNGRTGEKISCQEGLAQPHDTEKKYENQEKNRM